MLQLCDKAASYWNLLEITGLYGIIVGITCSVAAEASQLVLYRTTG
jgi:hypothetical protein